MTTWINQPGNYTGDTWHIAAAMCLSDSISLVQTVHERDDKKMLQARAFYHDIGISDSRVLTVSLTETLESGLRLSKAADRVRYNSRHIQASYDALQKLGHSGVNICYVYQATALYLREASGKQPAPETLKNIFTKSLASEYPSVLPVIERRVEDIPSDAVLIVGRYAEYLKEYDADHAKIYAVVELSRCYGRQCCLVADASARVANELSKKFGIP